MAMIEMTQLTAQDPPSQDVEIPMNLRAANASQNAGSRQLRMRFALRLLHFPLGEAARVFGEGLIVMIMKDLTLFQQERLRFKMCFSHPSVERK